MDIGRLLFLFYKITPLKTNSIQKKSVLLRLKPQVVIKSQKNVSAFHRLIISKFSFGAVAELCVINVKNITLPNVN